jgi:hypothetical protein
VAESLGRHGRRRRRLGWWAYRYLEELVINAAILHGTKSYRYSREIANFHRIKGMESARDGSGSSDPRT